MVRSEAGRLSFRHQLIQDALAAWQFARNHWLPEPKRLQTLTMNRQSYEALVIVIEDNPERSDEMLLGIYDWDYAAALSCLVDAGRNADDRLGTAICALVAVKLDEPFLHTRRIPERRRGTLQRCLGIDEAA